MADVFVSYHKQDRERAEEAVASLVAHGYTVWWDDRVTPLETWDKIVEREIRQARCVLVLWTKNSVESEWVRIEANFAKVARPAKLVQVRLEECDVPINFSLIQHADAFDARLDPESNHGWERALEWVGLFVGARPAMTPAIEPEPPPPPPPKPPRKRRRKASPPTRRAAEEPDPKPHPIPSPQPTPVRGLATVTHFGGGYYRTGLIAAVIGAIVGMWLYSAAFGAYMGGGATQEPLRLAAFFLLRGCVAAALALALMRTDRLDRRDATILGVGFVAAYLIYPIFNAAIRPTLNPPPAALSLFGDLALLGLLWLLARHLGALRERRALRGPIAASMAIIAFALGLAIAIENHAAPEPYSVGAWALLFGASVMLEAILMLTLFEPVRAPAGEHASVNPA